MTWSRHRELQQRFCYIAEVDDASYRTACNGRFNVGDVNDFEMVEHPPAAKRCDACIRNGGERFSFDMGDTE